MALFFRERFHSSNEIERFLISIRFSGHDFEQNIMISLFVDVAQRAASILKKDFVVY